MMYYIVYRLITGESALAVQDDGNFLGGEDVREAIRLVPQYKNYHAAGFTWSMMALSHYTSFHPHVVAFKNMSEIESVLLDKKILKEKTAWGKAQYTMLKDNSVLDIVFDPELVDERKAPFWENES